MTLVSVTAYHSFGGEVEASNTPTIRRLTPSCRHQLPRIAHDVLLSDFALSRINCMATLLMPLPDSDFDPTESGVPWRTMRDHGHNVVFATPAGRTARADPKMVTGEGLGILSPLLKADANGRSAYLY